MAPNLKASAVDSSSVQTAVEGSILVLDALAIYGDVDSGKIADEVIIADDAIYGELTVDSGSLSIQYLSQEFYQTIEPSPIDSFKYQLKYDDGTFSSKSVWVSIDSILGTNNRPIAFRDSFMVVQDSGVINADILKNDLDPDKAGLKVSVLSGGYVKHGVLRFHSDAFRFENDYLFFPNDGTSFSNKNLLKAYDDRDMSYLSDYVFIYEPDLGFYGYDSVKYVVSEYRPTDLPFFMEDLYDYVWNEDRDTATAIFYVEAHDFIPEAVNDTVYQLSETSLPRYMLEADVRTTEVCYPLANDIEGDTVLSNPLDFLDIAYILEHAADSAVASEAFSRVVFYHDIPQCEGGMITYRRDSNVAYISPTRDSIYYTYAPDFCGVDSLFYAIVEQDLVDSDYPNYYRGDTSALGIVYFVVEPVNDAPCTMPDTLDFSLAEAEELSSHRYQQLFDILANDVDIDEISDTTLYALERLMKDRYQSEFATFADIDVKVVSGVLLDTEIGANPGAAQVIDDTIVYKFVMPYNDTYLVDSFKYNVYNANKKAGSEWAYVRQSMIKAENDTFRISMPFVENIAEGTIANNLLFTANDVSEDTIMVVYHSGDTLLTPSKSSYAHILKGETGDANYFYNKGFVERDSFQYVVANLFKRDTAWVFLINGACEAMDDAYSVEEDPFADPSEPYYEVFSILENDTDPEGIINALPLTAEGDTLDTESAQVSTLETADGIAYKYEYKREFFYKDSFVYWITDIPLLYAAEGLFTRDSAFVFVEDDMFILDSDGDGLVNTMEDNVEGYQKGEEDLDTNEDGIPNYLDPDADRDGFLDGGDCDGDGIPNFYDDDSGCTDIEVSTAFTPNNDGVNDYFEIPELKLVGDEVTPATMRIYNRWGSLVYENTSYGKDGDWWDGTIGDVKGLSVGKELPNGVYLYYLEYNLSSFKKEGFVHIQR